MFFNSIKEIIVKKRVKKRFSNVKLLSSDRLITSVGIVFEYNNLHKADEFITILSEFGIQKENIEVIVFKKVIKKKEFFPYQVFSYADFSWTGFIQKKEINSFTERPFDLLLSYYDEEKAPLMAVTLESKADFKVGFSSVDRRLNHFMINTDIDNHNLFIEELFKYLKILNKIT